MKIRYMISIYLVGIMTTAFFLGFGFCNDYKWTAWVLGILSLYTAWIVPAVIKRWG